MEVNRYSIADSFRAMFQLAGIEVDDLGEILKKIDYDYLPQGEIPRSVSSIVLRIPGLEHDLYLRIEDDAITIYLNCWKMVNDEPDTPVMAQSFFIVNGLLNGELHVIIVQNEMLSMRWLAGRDGSPYSSAIAHNYMDLDSTSADDILSSMSDHDMQILTLGWQKGPAIPLPFLLPDQRPEEVDEDQALDQMLNRLMNVKDQPRLQIREADLFYVLNDLYPWMYPEMEHEQSILQ